MEGKKCVSVRGGGYDKLLVDVPMAGWADIDALLPFGNEGKKEKKRKKSSSLTFKLLITLR